jgi:hypothetical protein
MEGDSALIRSLAGAGSLSVDGQGLLDGDGAEIDADVDDGVLNIQ